MEASGPEMPSDVTLVPFCDGAGGFGEFGPVGLALNIGQATAELRIKHTQQTWLVRGDPELHRGCISNFGIILVQGIRSSLRSGAG